MVVVPPITYSPVISPLPSQTASRFGRNIQAEDQIFFQRGSQLLVVDVDLSGTVPVASPERPLVSLPANAASNLTCGTRTPMANASS